MAIEIKNYDGTTLTVIQDGTADNTSASIPFVGRGYKSWGTPLQQNILWILQNFAGESEPTSPVTGQLWYDTVNSVLKTYNGSGWSTSQGIILQSTAPSSGNNTGSMWFDTVNMQLYVWNDIKWSLVGPLSSSAGTDPVDPSLPSNSSIDSIRVVDNVGGYHNIWRLVIGGTLLATFSRDASFIPSSTALLSNGFPRIYPGITFNNTLANIDVGVFGDDTVFKSTQTNLPGLNNLYSLGSAALKFLNIFANNGYFSNIILGTSGTVVSESAAGKIKLTDSTGADFEMLQFGGTTAAYPAIRRNGTTLDFRLANDSAAANITAGTVTATTLNVTNFTATDLSANSVTLSNTGTGSRITQTADGVILLTNDVGTGFTKIQLGGTTAAFPAIERNTTSVDFRLANDSGAANISAGVGTFTSTTVSGAMTVGTAGSKISNSADGVLLLSNNAVTGFTRLQLGGTTASFPAIKRNGAALNFRLADDTADANITAGALTATGAITTNSSTTGIGYATGAGDTLTQATSDVTAVASLGSMTGRITLFSALRNSQAASTFTFTNPSIAATDHVIVTHISAGTLGAYNITATPAAGSASITIRNVSTSNLTEAPVLKYTIIKSVNA